MPYIRRVAALLTLVLASAFVFSVVWNPPPLPGAVGLPSAAVPTLVAGYASSGDQPPTDDIKAALPGAEILSRNYAQGQAVINFLLVSGEHNAALHDPRQCLGSLLLSAPLSERLEGTPVTMQVWRASSRPGALPDLLVAYFYVSNGQIISSPSQIRNSLFWGDLLGRENAPVYFFRFVEPLGPDSDARLQVFARQMWNELQPKIGPPHPPEQQN